MTIKDHKNNGYLRIIKSKKNPLFGIAISKKGRGTVILNVTKSQIKKLSEFINKNI